MARCMFRVVLCSFALLLARADERLLLTEEDERRWNTPPELIPEQATRISETKNARSLLIPITTNININNGNNGQQALGYEFGPEDVNFAAHSVSIAAGLTGIALSEASSETNLGGAIVASSASLQNGHANTAAISSAGQGTSIRFPGPSPSPVWTNIRPNNNNGYHPSRMPKLGIEVIPNRQSNRRPIMLHISSHDARFENRQPKIHIHKWQPSYGGYYEDEQR